MSEEILEEKLLKKMKQATYYKKKYLEAKNIIKEVREYIKQTGQYVEDIKRFKVDVLEPNYLDILEILDKGE